MVKEQLALSGPLRPEQRFMAGLVQKLEGRLDSLRERMGALRAQMADWARDTLDQFKQAGVSALDRAMSALKVKERKPLRAGKPAAEQEAAGTLAAAARALSKKQKSQEAEMGGEQLSLDMLMQPEPPQEPEAQEAPSQPHVEEVPPRKKVVVDVIRSPDLEREYQERLRREAAPAAAEPPAVSYDLGYGHAGSGLNVWNRLETVNGDYKTIAHIHPNREVVFYDDHLPEEVKEQIRQVAATSEMTVSATQGAPVFSTPPQRTEPVQEENRAPWWDEYNSIKEAHPDSIVLYQVGDFYEMYGEDAKVAAPLLGIGLHTRNIPDVGRVEFCGIPAEKLNRSVSRLREQRHDVTVAGMDEDTGKRRIRVMFSIQNEQADTRAEDYPIVWGTVIPWKPCGCAPGTGAGMLRQPKSRCGTTGRKSIFLSTSRRSWPPARAWATRSGLQSLT